MLLSGSSTWTRRTWRAWPSLALILTALATSPAITSAQPISGALGVSLVVLPPASTQRVDVISFRVDRDGIARLETTAPIAGSVSAIVVSTVSSSANGFVPLEQSPALVSARRRREGDGALSGPADARAPGLRFEVALDAGALHAGSHDVSVRITYLVVPGT